MAVSENDLLVGPLTPAAGVTTISLDFYFEQASWLEVYKSGSETPLVLDTDYTVSGEGTSSGVVTLTTPANGTDSYSVYLVVPLQRSSDLQLRGEFKSGPFNVELDRMWQALQGIDTRLGRTFSLSKTSAIPAPLFSETPAARAGKALIFSSDGTGLDIGDADIGFQNRIFDDISAFQANTTLSHAAVSEGDYIRIGSNLYQVTADGAGDGHYSNVSALVEVYEAGPNFSTRARMVAAKARMDAAGDTVPVGTIWSDDSEFYRFLDDGNTNITGMTGWGLAAGAKLFDDVASFLLDTSTIATNTIVRTRSEQFAYIARASGGAVVNKGGQTFDILGDSVTPKHFGSPGALANKNPAVPVRLSDRYATLAEAQAVYPKATTLNHTVDDMAFQAMVDYLRDDSDSIVQGIGDLEINKNTYSNTSSKIQYVIPRGVYYIERTIDFTGIRFGHSFWGIHAEKAVILGNVPGGSIMDFVHSRRCVFTGSATITGVWTSSGVCRSAMQFARNTSGQSAEGHIFADPWEFDGKFSIAAIHNAGAEVFRYGNIAIRVNLDNRARHMGYESGSAGTFLAYEPVSWHDGSGRIKEILDQGATGAFVIQVNSGNAPDLGDTITGSTSGKTADVSTTPVQEPSGEGPNNTSFCIANDGDNYFGITSDYQTVNPPNTPGSFVDCSGSMDLRNRGKGSAMFICRDRNHDYSGSYFVSDDNEFGAGVLAWCNTVSDVLAGSDMRIHFETDMGDLDQETGMAYAFQFGSSTAGRNIKVRNLKSYSHTPHAQKAWFAASSDVDTVEISQAEIGFAEVARDVGQVLFSPAGKFSALTTEFRTGNIASTTFLNFSGMSDLGGSTISVSAMTQNISLPASSEYQVKTYDGKIFSVGGGKASLFAFGASAENSAAENDVAFALAISWLNSASGRTLVVPSGSFSISNVIPTITQSDVEIVGEAGAELFKIASAANANFFKIGGSAVPVTNRVKILGFTCKVESGGPVSGYVAALDNTVDCEVSDIRCENVPGLIQLGVVADTARTTFRRWTGNFNSDANLNLCVFTRWTGLKLTDFKVYGSGGTVKRTADTFNFSVVGLCDTLHFDRVEVFSPSSANFAIDCNIDNGSMVNCWFNDCVFDKHGSANGAVRISSTPASTASSYDLTTGFWRAQNWRFNNCRWDTGGNVPGGTAVRITQLASTGFSRISGIHFNGCDFIYRDMEAIETIHTGTDGLKNITVRNCNFLEADIAPITDCIRMGNSDFNISGNSNSYAEANEAPNTTNFVKTTADVDNFVISGNMIEASTTAVSHFAYAVPSTSRQVYGNTETTGELP